MGHGNPSLVRLRADHLLVGADRAIELVHRSLVTDPKTPAHILQHGHIVRYHDDTTLKSLQCLGERIHTLNIQMVRRLVENQDVRVCQ